MNCWAISIRPLRGLIMGPKDRKNRIPLGAADPRWESAQRTNDNSLRKNGKS